jgi:hypothetical protein
MPPELRRSARRRIQTATEALLPGLPSENMGLLANDVARLAQAALLRGGTAPTAEEQEELSKAVDASASRFLSHLSKRSTAELWESFAVPWNYSETLARARSGRYAAGLSQDASWALAQTVALFSSTPPRTANQARKAARMLISGRSPVRLPPDTANSDTANSDTPNSGGLTR